MPKKTTKKKTTARKNASPRKSVSTRKTAKTPSKKAKKTASSPSAKKAGKNAAKPAPAKKKVAQKSKTASSPARSKTKPRPKTGLKPGPRFPILGRKVSFIEMEKRLATKTRKLSKSFLVKQEAKLLDLREHIMNQMQGVAQDSLRSKSDAAGSAFGMHQADAGSDAYEKDFALSLLTQEQDALYEVEEAIKRIKNGSYGICEMSGEQIPLARLEAIPHARFTATCQEQMEKEMKNRGRWETSAQFMNSSDNFFEESDNSEDDERSTNKD